jgi:type IV pilus assembly protein PilW
MGTARTRQTRRAPKAAAARGFTLIELMVGLTLALITTVIIAEVMLKSEGNRRTTTEGSDAQVNGALALFAMQREIQMAGYGIISNTGVLGCTIKAQYGSHAVRTATLAPVLITSGGSASVSDAITVLRSGSNDYAVPIITTAAHGSSDTAFSVQSSLGVVAGDTMMAMPATPDSTNWCTVFTVNASSGSALSATNIPHVTGTSNWNPSTGIMPTSYASGSTLAKISQLVYRRYAVSSNDLQATDSLTADDTPVTTTVGSQIVLLKAFYGKASGTDGVVDSYDTTTPTTTAGWKQVRTIRIALVARSAQREKNAVTTADPLWNVGSTVSVTGSAACGSNRCVTLQVSPATGTNTEWQHYRYKVFDTVVPLRNMLWTS